MKFISVRDLSQRPGGGDRRRQEGQGSYLVTPAQFLV
jgi:hypothetical protein